jgi:ubiquitin-protein ligase
MRRLRNDRAALDRLQSESSVFRFSAQGDLPQHYQIALKGTSLWRDRGRIRTLEAHRIEIKLGASYPRTVPEIRWLTPIYHPNISEIGMVCLGGYGTHWVPSVQLDELCIMLWDMARYHNYDIRSPYNRDAALWVASQTKYPFPTDPRSLRDKRVSQGRVASGQTLDSAGPNSTGAKPAPTAGNGLAKTLAQAGASAPARVREFISRYRGSRTNGSEPGPDGQGASNEPAQVELELVLVSDLPAVVPSGTAQPPRDDREEVVLLESVTTLESARESAIRTDDDIIFLE